MYADYLSTASGWDTAAQYYTRAVTLCTNLLAGHDVTHDSIDHHYSLRVWSKKLGASRDVQTAVARVQPGYVKSRISIP